MYVVASLIVAAWVTLYPRLLEAYQEPVNPPIVASLCRYGEEPGTWLDLPSMEALQPYPLQRMRLVPDDKLPHKKVGGRWQLYNKDCQLSNRIRADLLDPPQPDAPTPRTNVFFIGDSIDGLTLEYTCYHYAREYGINITRDVECPPIPCLHTGNVALAGSAPNHCITERFAMFHRFVATANPEEVDFNELLGLMIFYLEKFSGVKEPQLVVMGLEFWELAHLSWDVNRTYEQVNMDHTFLPKWWLESFRQNYTSLIRLVRQKLPSALIVVRTNAFPWYDCQDGKPQERKGWAKKMFVGQMNAAIRATARELNLPLIDVAAMSEGMVPQQYLNPGDYVHSLHWLNLEAFNIALNILHQYTAVTTASNSR
ncbi:hypothetical protein Agub_g12517 [Astrephomene gubernaculifera]|uniref:SGNH hydrolase-type esterase domain-containing protein n=1 Tax=Astrephomene gubernaculifera TaxID=47775 RepID=A0AAD3E0P6_9CHLO|nr:hypothetical protein Agub_g12517 [Astrephomene gubernaculifera]